MKQLLALTLMLIALTARADLASSTFSIDFSGIGDTNPYTHASITNIDGTAQIASGTFRANTTDETWQRFRYNGTVSGDTMRVSMRVTDAANYNQMGVGFLAADGSGYVATVAWGAFIAVSRIASDKTLTDISGGQEEIDPGFETGGLLHFDLTLSSGFMQVHYENPNAVPPVTETLISALNSTDTTYTASDLRPAIVQLTDGGGYTISAWGADAGGGGSSNIPAVSRHLRQMKQ